MVVFKSGSIPVPPPVPTKSATTKTAVPPPIKRSTNVRLPTQSAVKVSKEHIGGARRLRAKELPAFSRQLSAMLLAGMPLIQVLDALEDQTSDKNFKILIVGLKNYLQAGASFSEALSHYPTVFDTSRQLKVLGNH